MAFVRSLINHHRHINFRSNFLASVFHGRISRSSCFHEENHINPKLEARLKRKDNVEEEYRILYRAPYEIYCKVAYSTCWITSTVLPATFSSLIYTQGVGQYPVILNGIELLQSDMDLAILAAGLVIFISQVSFVIFRYPFRIYHKESDNTFLLIYQHLLPWKYDKEVMNAGELVKINALFNWNHCLYKFRNRRAIIFDYLFRKPSDFNAMLKNNVDSKSA